MITEILFNEIIFLGIGHLNGRILDENQADGWCSTEYKQFFVLTGHIWCIDPSERYDRYSCWWTLTRNSRSNRFSLVMINLVSLFLFRGWLSCRRNTRRSNFLGMLKYLDSLCIEKYNNEIFRTFYSIETDRSMYFKGWLRSSVVDVPLSFRFFFDGWETDSWLSDLVMFWSPSAIEECLLRFCAFLISFDSEPSLHLTALFISPFIGLPFLALTNSVICSSVILRSRHFCLKCCSFRLPWHFFDFSRLGWISSLDTSRFVEVWLVHQSPCASVWVRWVLFRLLSPLRFMSI